MFSFSIHKKYERIINELKTIVHIILSYLLYIEN